VWGNEKVFELGEEERLALPEVTVQKQAGSLFTETTGGALCSPPLPHHRAAISAAVRQDTTTILLAPPAMSFKLTMGMSPFHTATWCEFKV
jgi:hypothetical protein